MTKDERTVIEYASRIDKGLSQRFYEQFNRKPDTSDKIHICDAPFDAYGMGVEEEDGDLSIFAFFKDGQVYSPLDYGFVVCRYSPLREQYYEGDI